MRFVSYFVIFFVNRFSPIHVLIPSKTVHDRIKIDLSSVTVQNVDDVQARENLYFFISRLTVHEQKLQCSQVFRGE